MANVQNSIAQYPKGFTNGVTVRGVPLLNSYSGNVWWVDSNGAQIGDGKFNRPFATIDTAINNAAAGDIIMVKAGHAETLTTAGAITMDVAGIAIVGLGIGNKRPVLTFTPAAVSTNLVTWTAANCSFENIVCVAGFDAMTNPFNISGAGAYLDIEWQDGSAAIEAETVLLTTTAADRLVVNMKYVGFTAGDACVAPIKLVGCTGGRINVDFYGKASTAVVNFITTLSTDVVVTGYAYNATDTTGAKLVVDTIGSSTWYAEIYAGAAGQKFKGGSGLAIAGDPTIASVTNALYDTSGITTWPAEAAAANNVSIAEVLLYIQNAVRRGSGTTLAANKSVADAMGTDGATVTDSAVTVLGAIGADNNNNAFASTSVVGNADGSVLERLEYLSTQSGTPLIITKTITSSAIPNNTQAGGALTGAASGGLVLEKIILQTDGTGVVAPTNIEISTDNAKGLTGAGGPNVTTAVSGLGANKTVNLHDASGEVLPLYLETGKKLYIHGDDAAGTGAGTVDVVMYFRRVTDGATIAAA